MRKLKAPESQQQEVLHELLTRLTIDRRLVMLSCGVLNLPDAIMKLKKKGVQIITERVETVNKFGRSVSFGKYRVINKKEAIEVYNSMFENPANNGKATNP